MIERHLPYEPDYARNRLAIHPRGARRRAGSRLGSAAESSCKKRYLNEDCGGLGPGSAVFPDPAATAKNNVAIIDPRLSATVAVAEADPSPNTLSMSRLTAATRAAAFAYAASESQTVGHASLGSAVCDVNRAGAGVGGAQRVEDLVSR